jgi:hypothetical protein
MQFSETVVAAMIGAIATLSTALFQLFTALRSRGKLEMRPKKGMTFRSIVAVVALMAASGVGGYLYAELRQQHAGEDIRSMRDELNAKLQLLATTTERLAQARDVAAQSQSVSMGATAATTNSAESVIYAPPCQLGAACTESAAQKWLLCSAIPNAMKVRKLDLFAKGANSQIAWDRAAANFEQDIGGAKFTGAPSEHPEDETRKAVCVEFMHWSAEPHIARLVVQYGAEEHPPAAVETAAVAAAAIVPTTQNISAVTPTLGQ